MNLEKYYLEREDTMLLVVDIQSRLLPTMSRREEVLENSMILLKACNQMGLPVVVSEQYSKGLGSTVEELSEELSLDSSIVEKIEFSACAGKLPEYLEKKDRKRILIIGIETHICIYQTVRDLLKDGYYVYVVNDAVSSRSELDCNNAIELMRDMGAVIVTTEMAIFDLLKVAGTEEFKKISKLVK